ncbi:MAG: hypothetical protein LBQ66_04840 [Planctomycetaceae bacterium]|jgi:hypothetical protein|nr:hypothetical protein [Planctomycetaceae bacterium]
MKVINLLMVIFVLFIFSELAESVSAQPIRRLIRRILDAEKNEPYRVGNENNNNNTDAKKNNKIDNDLLYENDTRNTKGKENRLIERAIKTINLFSNNGQELKPVIVVSLTSFAEFKRVSRTVAEKIRQDRGNQEEPIVLDTFLKIYEEFVNKYFDTKQPFGLILQTDGLLYYPLAFMPLNADSKIFQKLEGGYIEKLEDGRYAIKQDLIRWPLGRLYVQKHNGWVFIATELQLDSLPDNPTQLLPAQKEKNTIFTARFDLTNLPQLSTRAALSLAEIEALSKAETVIEKATTRLSIGQIRSIAEQSDFLEYSFFYDEENNDYVIKQIEIVKQNTEKEKILQQRQNVTSPFHSFYVPENAIFGTHFALHLTQLEKTQYEIILDETIGQHLLTAQERNELKSNKPATQNNPTNKNTVSKNNVSGETGIIETKNDGLDVSGELYLPELKIIEDGDVGGGDVGAREKLSEFRKFEIMLRRIGVCYYWGLLGSIRNGKFDIATTWSDEQGLIGAFKITEGERFQKAFDLTFSQMSKEFPDLYAANVRKDYRQDYGFKLTSVSVKLSELLRSSPIGFLVLDKLRGDGLSILLAVRGDAVCYSVCDAGDRVEQERRFLDAIAGVEKTLPVYDMFFVFSAYELGKSYAKSGNPNRFTQLKTIAENTSQNARINATTKFTNNSKTLTFRINAILTPSLWRMRDNLQNSKTIP